MSSTKTLAERLLAFETVLNDGSDVYAGDALKSGKGLEKAQKGRSNLAADNDEPPLVVIDSTVWGSVAEGFYITENHIHGKELLESPHSFEIQCIHSVFVDEDKKSISINGTSIKWLGDTTTAKMKIISDCIQEHIDSRIDAKATAQQGRGHYLEELKKQLFVLQTATWRWGIELTIKIGQVTGDFYNYMPTGCENFLERTAIAIRRKKALFDYDGIRKEAEEKIRSLNEAVPVCHANAQCDEFEVNGVEFSYDFGYGPDRNTSISNDDWQSNMEDALNQLQECASHLEEQFDVLIDKLDVLQKEECDEDD